MALEKCSKCGKTFWCAPQAKLCAICTVVEKSRQAAERQTATAEKVAQELEVAVA
jgi:hypothetical protein